MQGFPLLSFLTWLPIAGGVVVLVLGDRAIKAGRYVALITAVVALLASIPLYTHFNAGTFELQFREQLAWIPALHSTYFFGVDGISMPLILLTTLITVPVILAAWTVIDTRPAQYYAAFLIMEGLMVGVFSAADALLFYFFWEAMLIPMFLIIGVWGGPRRVYATLKFFLYTFFGSVFMLVALIYMYVQTDMKKLVAYSSIAHMGFVTLGAFLVYDIYAATGNVQGAALGISGAMVQMISHGLISGALFLCVGVMYDRVHSREISAYGGVINTMPKFGAFMVLFALANSGLPGTSGFVGEFMVIIASFKANFWYAFLAAVTLILGAAYTLWLVKRVIFGEVANHHVAEMQDLNGREFFNLGLLAIGVLLLGLWPAPLTEVMETSIQHLVQQISASKLPL
jgi:NADH:ubiquinone oxidoreductase subunit 4 (subunit M)